jgi:hypothetical protein
MIQLVVSPDSLNERPQTIVHIAGCFFLSADILRPQDQTGEKGEKGEFVLLLFFLLWRILGGLTKTS